MQMLRHQLEGFIYSIKFIHVYVYGYEKISLFHDGPIWTPAFHIPAKTLAGRATAIARPCFIIFTSQQEALAYSGLPVLVHMLTQ